MKTKSIENKARRHLAKKGQALRKLRNDEGYMIIDARTSGVIFNNLTLDEVIQEIN